MTTVEIPTERRAVPSQYRKPSGLKDVYTVAEVCERLGLSLSGTYELVRSGTIPARKLGGRWVIPKERFHAWLNAEDQADTPDAVPATHDHDRRGGFR